MLLLLLLAATGCGAAQPRGEVEGTVRCTGQPLANVLVTFLPDPDRDNKGPRSSGVTDKQGRYRLASEDGQAGAVVGWHRVVVEDLSVYRLPRSADGMLLSAPPERFAHRCNDPLRTPLVGQVESGGQTINFDLPGEPGRVSAGSPSSR